MKNVVRYTAVSAIAVFAGLVASCDAAMVGGFFEDSIQNLNEFVAVVIFLSPFVITVASIIKFSTTTGTIRGDCERAFVGVFVVGCLTPVVVLPTIHFDQSGFLQKPDSIYISLAIGGVIALIGLIGWSLLRRDDADTEKRGASSPYGHTAKRRKTPLYGPVSGKPNDSA